MGRALAPALIPFTVPVHETGMRFKKIAGLIETGRNAMRTGMHPEPFVTSSMHSGVHSHRALSPMEAFDRSKNVFSRLRMFGKFVSIALNAQKAPSHHVSTDT